MHSELWELRKKNLNCEIKSCNFLFIFHFGGNRLSDNTCFVIFLNTHTHTHTHTHRERERERERERLFFVLPYRTDTQRVALGNSHSCISEKSRNFCKGFLETSGSCCQEVVVEQGKRMDSAEHSQADGF